MKFAKYIQNMYKIIKFPKIRKSMKNDEFVILADFDDFSDSNHLSRFEIDLRAPASKIIYKIVKFSKNVQNYEKS